LAACQPLEGQALEWFAAKLGIGTQAAADLAERLGLRFCGPELLADLKRWPALRGFAVYRESGCIAIPYIRAGRPVYLKARPPCGKEEAERRHMPRFLAMPGPIPCPYNVDSLATRPGRVLVTEGESDCWAALAAGYAAVGIPGAAACKPEWVKLFRSFVTVELDEAQTERAAILQYDAGYSRADAERLAGGRVCSRVFLALDPDQAGDRGAGEIGRLFVRAGLPPPRRLPLKRGEDLADFLGRVGRSRMQERIQYARHR